MHAQHPVRFCCRSDIQLPPTRRPGGLQQPAALRPQLWHVPRPVNGTYVFCYHRSVYQQVLKVGLFHSFVPVIKTTEPQGLGTTSHSVVLHLARGDQVWVHVKDSVSKGMNSASESSSTFSGFLLYTDRCDVPTLAPMIPPEGGYRWGG